MISNNVVASKHMEETFDIPLEIHHVTEDAANKIVAPGPYNFFPYHLEASIVEIMHKPELDIQDKSSGPPKLT